MKDLKEKKEKKEKKELNGANKATGTKRYWILPLFAVFFIAFCLQYYGGHLIGVLQDDVILAALILVITGAVNHVIRLVRHWKYKKMGTVAPKMSRRGRMICVSCLAALLLAEGILLVVRYSQKFEKPVEEAGISYVSLEELEGGNVEKTASQRFNNSVSYSTSFAVPKQYDLRMAGRTEDGLPVTMQVCLYEVAWEGLAAPMFEAIMQARMDWNQILMQWKIEADVEEAYAAGYMGFQYLFLRDGKRIVTVYYYGEQDLNEQVDLFVEMLKNGD